MISTGVKSLASICGTCCFVLTTQAQVTRANAPGNLNPSYSSIETALFERASARADEGRYDWGSPATAVGGGTISLGREYPSSDPTVRCGACIDPCRRFRLSFRSSRGFGEYLGRMCYSPTAASWTIKSLEEEEWTALSPPPPPPPPPPAPVPEPEQRTIYVSQPDPDKQVLSVRDMLDALSAPLASLGYIASDAEISEAVFETYADDHRMKVSLSELSERSDQNEIIETATARAETVDRLRDAALSDEVCAQAREIVTSRVFRVSACLTTRAQ